MTPVGTQDFPHPLQSEIINDLHVQPTINAAEEISRRVDFLCDYFRTAHAKGFVLGISGGQDSTLAGRLAQLAVEKLRDGGEDATFIAIRLPHGVQADEDDAQVALQFIQPDQRLTIDIAPATAAITTQVTDALAGSAISDFNKGNIKARMRMIAQYAVAGVDGALVIGTDHAAEAVTGFYTKHGDGACDLVPLQGLSKRQGAALLRHLGAPASTWEKVPTADLEEDRPALPDEVALGVTYTAIDDYLEGKAVSDEDAARIEHLYSISRHKRAVPPGPADSWWR
ncbi:MULTISPECIES: ammonia-dependent NAD(+) synthetase [Corynebacterium]|uniref:ammonia-dependent NAD(+) synthetase n=2 Tax=Corynebacteriaceae TaxID=1653 RepID=UPI00034E62E4|nr:MULTISPECIES: ammonia-dependent NAD(+) synthetase [Corynebacterium]ASE57539.1 ammonia-dependent NAD(+) synthetase [Corynebacterium jeikeium]EPD47683.1 NAD+ synthetase [Corynebacterium sp. HFH0082]KAA0878976.1 ammonia-dependent NAD(+) synthetase [Corynebacterium amycolatum]MBC6806751.1 ammonia-dependent NAD(+) synthetase [Corynebacterium sp. LK30]MCG7269772.1 ammonia-dependent NAD(+) synthetase [Corynebacterium amycolatum]